MGSLCADNLPINPEPHGTSPMIQALDPVARTLAAATVLGAMVLVGPWTASAADVGPSPTLQLAQAASTTSPPSSAAKSKPRRSMADRVEDRIKRLHDELKITPDQEPKWQAVADAMREDSKAMQATIEDRRANRATMTAVDDLRSYQKVAETHVQGLQRLIPAFQSLYDSMSPDQKKNADTVFGQRRHGRMSHAKTQPKPQQ
jgi:periplasmic protein CpxP/Spy